MSGMVRKPRIAEGPAAGRRLEPEAGAAALPDEPDIGDAGVCNEEPGDAEAAFDLSLDETVPAPETPELLRAGTEIIAGFARTLPGGPGVYRMFDAAGEVLYVGKARNLKKRVQQYALGKAHTNRIVRMIAETASMEFVTTATETEALLLEANLIKQLRPRYNVLLRDDKSFPYILLTRDHSAPQIAKHRGARNRAGDYYGPFASAGAVGKTINALQRAFLLRSCADSVYDNRSRPCLLFQIKRCAAPCTGEVSSGEYLALVNEARDFLSGRSTELRARLGAEMQEAAGALDFERAARLRDRLAAMAAIQSTQDVNPQGVEEADVFAIAEEAGQFCVQVFFFRSRQNWGNRAYFPKAHASLSLGEILESFVAQFYDDKPCPRLVLLSHEVAEAELLADALSAKSGARVEVAAPKRGEKKDLADHAERNAKEALSRRLADTASQSRLLDALAAALALKRPLRRIEVYDNSHVMGTNAVGAMIVAGAAGFMKPHYRTFNIKSQELVPGDDFGMMREVLTRRFSRLKKEAADRADAPGADAEDAFPAWPDLVVIDGGKGQLSAVLSVLQELGLADLQVVAVAKGPDRNAGREQFHAPGREPIMLEPRDPALYFIQRLRDEAHRFAIGAHRQKRKREMTANPLDDIPGIGPRRKRALMLHFGTVKAIRRASLDDLMRTPGVNEATARAVHDFFAAGG
jgi:excinuclease ABC subunit C